MKDLITQHSLEKGIDINAKIEKMKTPLLDIVLKQLELAQAIPKYQVDKIIIDESVKMDLVEEIGSYVAVATGEVEDFDGVSVQTEVTVKVSDLRLYGVPLKFIDNEIRAQLCPFDICCVSPISIKLKKL